MLFVALFDVDVFPVVFDTLDAFVAFVAFFVEFLLVAFDILELFFAITNTPLHNLFTCYFDSIVYFFNFILEKIVNIC